MHKRTRTLLTTGLNTVAFGVFRRRSVGVSRRHTCRTGHSLFQVSDVFTHLVLTAAADTKGIVHSLSPDRCVVAWNLLSRCDMHVARALTAALQVRDGFWSKSREHKLLACRISMGLWSGPLMCGSVGNATFKTFAFIGQGVSRVCGCACDRAP